MAFIEVIQHESAEGELKEIYDELKRSRGKLAEIHKIQSLNPETITRHMDLYQSIMFGKSPLSREMRELLAVVVSMANNCEYCKCHHGEALNHFWKDEQKLNRLYSHYSELNLDAKGMALCRFAEQLTLNPSENNEENIQKLKQAGWEDRAILDAGLIISYFNFVNRMVLGLGVEIESGGCSGYKYE